MLLWIKISDYALIPAAQAEFAPGFNVITGETGAGKSIFLGAVENLFGARSELSVVRTGAARCEISGQFLVPEARREAFAANCEVLGIPFDAGDGLLNIKKIITRSGSRCFVNDSLATLATVRSITDGLAEIHTANSHQQLGQAAGNLELIDAWSDDGEALAPCRRIASEISRLRAEREAVLRDIPDAAEASRLTALVEDVAAVNPEPGEDEKVDARHRLAANASGIISAARAVSGLINDDGGAADRLGEIYRAIESIGRSDRDGAAPMLAKAAVISEELRELAGECEDYSEKIDLDQEAFEALEKRRSELFALRRRYASSIDRVLEMAADAAGKLEIFRKSEKMLEEYDLRITGLKDQLAEACGKLSAIRRRNAPGFARAVEKAMGGLGLEKGRIAVEFSPCEPGPDGADVCEIMFSANPGSPLMPLRSTASSGELSRMLLAVKSVMAERDSTPLLIFDEIDANLGGETAHRVGAALHELASTHQIIAISHLAQVAVRADRHFGVGKKYSENITSTSVSPLSGDERTAELARMLGGGENALRHAAGLVGKTDHNRTGTSK